MAYEIPSFLKSEWDKFQKSQENLAESLERTTPTKRGGFKMAWPNWVYNLPNSVASFLNKRLGETGRAFITKEQQESIRNWLASQTSEVKNITANINATGEVQAVEATNLDDEIKKETSIPTFSTAETPIQRMQGQIKEAMTILTGMRKRTEVLAGKETEAVPKIEGEPEVLGGYKVLYNAQGNRVEVSSEDETDARSRGYVYASSPIERPTERKGEGGPLTKEDIEDIVADIVDRYQTSKPTIEPFAWTSADTAAIKAEFEELYGSYYGQQMATAKMGARESLEALEETAALAIKRQERSLEEALTESRSAMAARGLAFSGIRQKEEKDIGEVSGEEMQRIRDLAARGRRQELAGLESLIGTAGVRELYPEYQIPSEYAGLGMQFPRGEAISGIPGTIPTERALAEYQEQARRQAEARQSYISDILMRESYG